MAVRMLLWEIAPITLVTCWTWLDSKPGLRGLQWALICTAALGLCLIPKRFANTAWNTESREQEATLADYWHRTALLLGFGLLAGVLFLDWFPGRDMGFDVELLVIWALVGIANGPRMWVLIRSDDATQ
jgi:hypothetical protein